MFLAPDPMTVVGGTSLNSKEQTLLTCLVPYEWADLTNGSMSADSAPTKKFVIVELIFNYETNKY